LTRRRTVGDLRRKRPRAQTDPWENPMTARTLRHDASVRFADQATGWLDVSANPRGHRSKPEVSSRR